MVMIIEFTGEIWFWKGPAPWFYVTMSAEQSQDLKAISAAVTYGWGVIPVYVRIGITTGADERPNVMAGLKQSGVNRICSDRPQTVAPQPAMLSPDYWRSRPAPKKIGFVIAHMSPLASRSSTVAQRACPASSVQLASPVSPALRIS